MRDVRGSDEEFVAFFSAHARALRRTAYGLVGDWDRAEDLTQSAFARVYPHWERVRRGNPHAYTRQTMVRLFIDGRKYAAEHLAAERRHFTDNLLHPNANEGLVAFLEKRSPRFE